MSGFGHIPPPKIFSNLRIKYCACDNTILIKTILFRSLFVVLLTIIYGCIILPVPTSILPDADSVTPFIHQVNSLIIPGSTTKMQVVSILGDPSARRFGERIYIYAAGQKDWLWAGFIVLPPVAVVPAYGYPTYLTHLLIIEFDKDDIVTAFQEICKDSGKLESGLYVVNSGGYITSHTKDRKWRFADKQLVILASETMDKKAREFAVPQNKSVIYYYKKFSDNIEATLDDNLSVDPESDGFLMWLVDPGEHRINTTHNFYWNALTMHCYPGEKYYIGNYKGTLKEEDKAIAEKEISERKLVIDRLDTFNFD